MWECRTYTVDSITWTAIAPAEGNYENCLIINQGNAMVWISPDQVNYIRVSAGTQFWFPGGGVGTTYRFKKNQIFAYIKAESGSQNVQVMMSV